MKNETASTYETQVRSDRRAAAIERQNPWLDYGLDDLFYALEEAEDKGQEAKAELIRQAIDTHVAA